MFDKPTIFESQGWVCEVCGMSVREYGTPQIAHRIPQSKMMLARYGKEVVHHKLNVAGVCSLKCNDGVSISNHPVEIEALVKTIKEIESEKSRRD